MSGKKPASAALFIAGRMIIFAHSTSRVKGFRRPTSLYIITDYTTLNCMSMGGFSLHYNLRPIFTGGLLDTVKKLC